MRKIFPIPLMRVGTPDVESFGSYLHRCAYEHGVFVGELMRFVYSAAVDAGLKTPEHVTLPHSFDISEIIGNNKLTAMLVHFFEEASGQQLASGTLLKFGDAVGRSAGALSKGFQWCPICLAEDIESGISPYFRLKWHFQSDFCHVHRIRLHNKCDGCGCNQRSWSRKVPLSRCQECDCLLTSLSIDVKKSEAIIQSWQPPDADLLQLMEDIAAQPYVVFCHRGIRESLQSLLTKYGLSGREEDFRALLSSDEFRAVVHEDRPVSLKLVRRLAYRLGVSIADLLSGNTCQTTEVIDPSWCEKLPYTLKVAKKSGVHNHIEVLTKVKRIIADSEKPLSMKELGRRAGVTVGYLQYRYPKLMQEIADAYETNRVEEQREKERKAQVAAFEFFHNEKYMAHAKSRKRAYKVLSQDTGLPKFMLIRAIARVHLAING